MKIVIAAPIRDRAWALPSWLEYLNIAAYEAERMDQVEVGFVFVENDSVDATLEILEGFAEVVRGRRRDARVLKHDIGYAHYKVPYSKRAAGLAEGEVANPQNDKGELAELRNIIVEEFLKMHGDYLVMWDSDVWMPRYALSSDQRSLISVMRWQYTIGTMAADTQHPHCRGKYHNGMVATRQGLYAHPDRKVLGRDRIYLLWVSELQNMRRIPSNMNCIKWDQRKARYSPWSEEILYLARVGTTGGGGATITRREMFLPPISARYGANGQGEDVLLCERIAKCGHQVVLYSGIRGLHLSRKLYEAHGVSDLYQYGEWVEEWLDRQEAEVQQACGSPASNC